ncbi:sigma-70 family RNA polymerase sigma factor [Lentzea sp. NPDC051213]|uniref:sigma-70 family RNA polymerase sigma factor n=1 Tax=Lentzea sp. NPDC051213 TaxID=3364126 RepID=UPI0037B1A71F
MTGREWLGQVDVAQVAAARAGDREALDAIVAAGLPLVYNIAGRALSSDADVDDVVQETMVRVIRGIESLREPERVRSWLVAVTINQIREHHRRRDAAPASLEEYDRPDPGAEFVEVALSRLHLAEQRREIDEAARWLDPADSELLALWTLERAGQLTRAEVAEALHLGAHAVTVRVSRLKSRLETIRVLVRALSADPRCAGLDRAAEGWSGRPEPLWRKRLLRHVDECGWCRRGDADRMPVERILTGAALLTVPAGYLPHLLKSIEPVAAVGLFGRIAHVAAAKPVLATTGAALVCAAVGVVAAVVLSPADRPAAARVAETSTSNTVTSNTVTSSTVTTVPPSSVTSSSPSSTPPPSSSTSVAPPPPPKPATPEERVLALINSSRAEAGLPPLKLDPTLVTAADRHNKAMIDGCGLSHQCPGESGLGERASAAGTKWRTVGENVGMAGPVPNAVEPISQKALGLTQSMLDEKPPDDGHRRNILSKSFDRVGIVVTRDAKGTVWITHDFAG